MHTMLQEEVEYAKTESRYREVLGAGGGNKHSIFLNVL